MTPRLLFTVCIAALGSPCGGADEAPAPQDAGPTDGTLAEEVPTHRVLIRTLTLPSEVEPGVVTGFDLDDRVSDGTDPADCSWEDFTAPDGTPGIDNQMAVLTPLFEPAGLGQAFEYLENSIEDSGFFHLFELRGVESFVDDDTVELIYESGGGSGLMDPEGDLVAYQTLCVQNDSPHVVAAEAAIADGVLRARFDELTFTFSMFERTYPFTFRDVRLVARLTEDGFLTDGVVGGSLAMSNIMDLVIKGAQNTGGLLEPMQLLLDGLGDMPSDAGPCTALSTSLDFTAVPVFFYPPESDCDPCGNDTCEYYESCETCLIDCCAGCGNGTCDFYDNAEHAISVTADGLDTPEVDLLVGDTLVWTNQTDGPINLICDAPFGSHSIESGETRLAVATASGTYTCWIHEQPGQLNVLSVDDNHSETLESCPQDCGARAN